MSCILREKCAAFDASVAYARKYTQMPNVYVS